MIIIGLVALIAIMSLVIYGLSFEFSKIIDMWFDKKPKESKTRVYCKRSKKFLTTSELFFGKCFSCDANAATAKSNCLTEIEDHVKS